MSNGGSAEQHIDAVDAFACALFLRARAVSSLSEVADAVKQLHISLRHLRAEVTEPDSLLNDASIPEAREFSRQLPHVIVDCEFTLSQLERLLDDPENALGSRVTSLRRKLWNESENVNDFLNEVQLFSPSPKPSVALISGGEEGLDDIKDKLDNVARRIFSGRTSSFLDEHDDDLWRELKAELEKEGFSKEVLQKNKDVLRAYIRELEALCPDDGDTPPTVRGLLEYENQAAVIASPTRQLTYPAAENEKFPTSIKDPARMLNGAPALPPRPDGTTTQPFSSSSEDESSESGECMALISTHDLVAMDHLNLGIANMQLQPYDHSYPGDLPRAGHASVIPANYTSLEPPHGVYELPGDPSIPNFGTSPNVTPLPAYSSVHSPPVAYSQLHTAPQLPTRLAPDRYGRDIPMEAQWTRIPRHLVSPEVLEKAGVRYEARPTYVAVLGRLSREKVKDLARQSADCRAARSLRQTSPRKPSGQPHERRDSRSSSEENDDRDLFSSEESTDADDDKTSDKKAKSRPYAISLTEEESASLSSTVQPKSILKNKKINRVHFGPNQYEGEGKSPRSLKGDREKRESHRHHRDHRDGDGYRHRRDRDEDDVKHRDDRDDDGARYRDHRDRHHRDRRRSTDREHYSRRRHRDDRYQDDRREREERRSRKKAWGETLGAVGVGGAAVSLLGVLAQAATGI